MTNQKITDLKRNEKRVSNIDLTSIDLTIEIRKKSFFKFNKYQKCSFVDIDKGGIGIVCQNLALNVMTKVELKINCRHQDFYLHGVIGFHDAKLDKHRYGIIFIDVPFEFDSIINKLMATKNSGSTSNIDDK